MNTLKAWFVAINVAVGLLILVVLPYLIIPILAFFIVKIVLTEKAKEASNQEEVEEEFEDFNPFR